MKGRDFKITEESQWNRIYQKAVKPYLEAGKVLSVSVGPYVKKRSVDQNAKYWATLNEIARGWPETHAGEYFAPEIFHEYVKRRFLGVVPGIDGKPVPKSTRKLSVVEMAGLITEVEGWAIEEGIIFDVDETVSF